MNKRAKPWPILSRGLLVAEATCTELPEAEPEPEAPKLGGTVR